MKEVFEGLPWILFGSLCRSHHLSASLASLASSAASSLEDEGPVPPLPLPPPRRLVAAGTGCFWGGSGQRVA